MAVERVGLVLGQDNDLEVSGVDDVRQGENRSDGNDLQMERPVSRESAAQRHQTLTLTARKNNS